MAPLFASSTGTHESATNLPSLEGIRILLAEDGPDNQRLISYLLETEGAVVTLAENGQIAVDAVLETMASKDEEPFDVVLMDIQMPVLDGYAATRQLREASYTGPVIALTAHAMAHDRNKCTDAGCNDYLAKPIDRNGFVTLVSCYATMSVTSC